MRLRSGVFLAMSAVAAAQPAAEHGLEAFRKRDFAAAEKIFGELVKANPSNARLHKLLGMTFAAQENWERAEAPFRRACALDPREEKACYYFGRVELKLARLDQALAAFDKALASEGQRGEILLGKALTLEALDRDAEAERLYRSAAGAGERQAWVDYGLFLFKRGRGEESLRALRKGGNPAELQRVEKALAARGGGPVSSYKAAKIRPVMFEAHPLAMVVRNGAAGSKHLIETMIAGVAVFDFDNDGWPDIFVANGATSPDLVKADASYHNRLFRNRRGGGFEDVTAQAGLAGEGFSMGAAAADYDNDGWMDLFVTGVRSNTLYRNLGDGRFENVTAKAGLPLAGPWSVAAAWLDFDHDGRLDLFVARYVDWDPAKEPYCGLPEPGKRQYCHPKFYPPLPNALYRNLGDGAFRDVSEETGIAAHRGKGMGVTFGDADGDGLPDIFVGNDTTPNFLFRNRGGRFEETALEAGVAYNDNGTPVSSMGVDFRDYDNDGRDDLFVTALSNETFPLFQNRGGRFADVTYPSGIGKASFPWTGWSAGMVDFNNDGRKDLFVAGGHVMDNAEISSGRKSRQPNLVFLNQGGGKFEMAALAGEALHRGAAFGDFDRDGRVDVAVTRLNEAPLVLRNVTPEAGHWIELRLEGRKSNRDAIGARVRVVSESAEQWNRVVTSVGYGGSSDKTLHFGLGADAKAKFLEIEWPSGAKQRLEDVAADRRIEVQEP